MKMDEIRNLIEEDKKTVSNLNELNDLKVKYLGKKGLITELNQEIRNLENRVYNLEREVMELQNKISRLENTPMPLNDNYTSTYQPNTLHH